MMFSMGELTRFAGNMCILLTSTWIYHVTSAVPPDLYMGCYYDGGDAKPRDFAIHSRILELTPKKCNARCLELGYMFFGLQDYTECRCSNAYGRYNKLSESSCSNTCRGNSRLKCGGPYINSVYRIEKLLSQFLGCYKEGTPRDLWGDQSLLDGTLSAPEVCVERCKKKGFHFAAVKNYAVCSCGVSFGRYGKANPKDCNPKCGSGEHCSTIDANSIYRTIEADLYLGCYIDHATRDLPWYYPIKHGDNTPINCCARCRVKGFRYCALQINDQCHCGNSYGRYGKGDCTHPCEGSPDLKCGGTWRNSVYAVEAEVKPPLQPGHEYMYTNPQGSAPLTRDHVIYTEKSVRDVNTCSQYCELMPDCQSINFNPVSMVCEMNNVTSSVVGSASRESFSYWEPAKFYVMGLP
ncbi:WSC domain-containing protein ARB_07867 [Nematostella vectensis]|uniref:WSC domain-containing protein ARB_07867 n=1 Tax=Nematostella vectensis TaxID=45351 RepID=UPI00207780BF|nr:WSC domain-containing protein ARB_07867 [Nematostella vectensis]